MDGGVLCKVVGLAKMMGERKGGKWPATKAIYLEGLELHSTNHRGPKAKKREH